MSFSIQVDDDEQHIAFYSYPDSSGVIAAYIVPGSAADAKDALPHLQSITGHDGTWNVVRLSGSYKPGRKGSAAK